MNTITEYDWPTLNTDLLKQMLEWAAADAGAAGFEHLRPEGWPKWDQGVWGVESECGTAACIAGNVAIQTPGYVLDNHIAYDSDENAMTISVERQAATINGVYKVVDGEVIPYSYRSVESIAIEQLGLTNNEAGALFESDNNLTDLVWLAMDFAEQRGLDPSTIVSDALYKAAFDGTSTRWEPRTETYYPEDRGLVEYVDRG